jgi:diphthine synthase
VCYVSRNMAHLLPLELGICGPSAKAIGLARVGHASEQRIVSGTLEELAKQDLGPPLHSLVLCGDMHPEEIKWFDLYRCKPQ